MRAVAILLLALGAGCKATPWQTSTPDGTWSVQTPGPLVEENPQDKGKNDTVYAANFKHGKYMVYLSEAAHVTDEKTIQDSLRQIAGELIEKSGGVLRYQELLKVDGRHHAIEFEVDRREEAMVLRARVIYANDRVFRLIASGNKSWMMLAEVHKFLQSFETVPSPKTARPGLSGASG